MKLLDKIKLLLGIPLIGAPIFILAIILVPTGMLLRSMPSFFDLLLTDYENGSKKSVFLILLVCAFFLSLIVKGFFQVLILLDDFIYYVTGIISPKFNLVVFIFSFLLMILFFYSFKATKPINKKDE